MKGYLIEINKETWWFRDMACYNRHMDEIKQLERANNEHREHPKSNSGDGTCQGI